MGAFLERVRDKSAYPVFRGVTTIFQFLGYATAFVIAAVGIFSGKLVVIIGALLAAVMVAVMSRLFAEMSLMMADATDAIIQSAEILSHAVEIRSEPGMRAEPVLSESATTSANRE